MDRNAKPNITVNKQKVHNKNCRAQVSSIQRRVEERHMNSRNVLDIIIIIITSQNPSGSLLLLLLLLFKELWGNVDSSFSEVLREEPRPKIILAQFGAAEMEFGEGHYLCHYLQSVLSHVSSNSIICSIIQ